MNQSRQPKYWLCDECAKKRNLVCYKKDNTVIVGLCGNCDRDDESRLTPIVDLRKSRAVEISK